MGIFSRFSTSNAGVDTPPPLSLAALCESPGNSAWGECHYLPHAKSVGNLVTDFPKTNIIEHAVDYL